MKKKLLVILVVIISISTGCTLLKSTPKSEVVKFLNNYKNNSKEVVSELDDYLKTEELDKDSLDEYKEIYLRQYSDMKYEIKDEKIDGDKATVDVLITVYDYYKANSKSGEYFTSNQADFVDDNGDVDFSKYLKYKIDNMLNTTDTVNYTLTLNLNKIKDGWEIEPLTTEQLTKIHGTYEY